jgi:hypothetical protein
MADTKFKQGTSGNKAGRPKGVSKSALRGILAKLKKMDQEAIDTIQKSLTEGSTVDKDKVQTAKWVVNTITLVHKAVLAEEDKTSVARQEAPEQDNEDTTDPDYVDRSTVAKVFSISMPDKKD